MKRSIKSWYALDIPEQEGIRKKYIVLKYWHFLFKYSTIENVSEEGVEENEKNKNYL